MALCDTNCLKAVSPALRMLATEIRNDVEETRVGALRVAFQDTSVYVLKPTITQFKTL